MRRPSSSGLWLDRVLCALLALLSLAALIYGLAAGQHVLAGGGFFGLAGAVHAAGVLFDREALRRAQALREARDREWR